MLEYFLRLFLPILRYRHYSKLNLSYVFIRENNEEPLKLKAVIEDDGEAIRFAMNEYPDNSVIIFKEGINIVHHRPTSWWVNLQSKIENRKSKIP